jgi:LmbE family N-acetylglucosaminyl deacetylase
MYRKSSQQDMRALGIVARPGDLAVLAGGTIALLTDQKIQVEAVIVTNTVGSIQAGDKQSAIQQRRDQETEACRRLGILRVEFLNHGEGTVHDNPRLRLDLLRRIQSARANLILTHGRDAFLPDQQEVANATLAARNLSTLRLVEKHDPLHFPPDVALIDDMWGMVSHPDMLIDISLTWQTKEYALAAYQGTLAGIFDDTVTEFHSIRGFHRGAEEAEGFRRCPFAPNQLGGISRLLVAAEA